MSTFSIFVFRVNSTSFSPPTLSSVKWVTCVMYRGQNTYHSLAQVMLTRASSSRLLRLWGLSVSFGFSSVLDFSNFMQPNAEPTEVLQVPYSSVFNGRIQSYTFNRHTDTVHINHKLFFLLFLFLLLLLLFFFSSNFWSGTCPCPLKGVKSLC